MQRAPYLLGERADSIRKGVIDPYGSHTYTLWRVHGWRMSLYSLARALRTHGRHYMFTRRSSSVDLGACLAPKGSMNATVAAAFVPILASNSAWRCPPSALYCCLCPVMHALGGSHGAAILCAKRLPISWRKSSIASAASGCVELGLLLCGALAHRSTFSVNCWRSARRFLRIS
jgi:hypothetical protein